MSITWSNVTIALARLKPWADNPRYSTKKQARALLQSWKDLGQFQTVAIGPDGEVYDGHQRLSALLTVFGGDYEVDARQSDRALTDDEHRRLIVTAHVGAVGSWDWDKLSGWDAAALRGWGMDSDALKAWDTDAAALRTMLESEQPAPVEDVEPQIDRAEELRVKWGVDVGQLWQLGEHRLICGDCTDRAVVERVMGGQKPDCMVTDPPYCSGGFQEAGKKSGSIGTRGDAMIANDTLSTRGYMALMKSVFLACDCGVAYVFTDWRMWVNLFDVAESSGYGVRNMVVWDKETPGIGRGWRSQHELVLCAMKVTQPFDPHKAQGNVIRCSRTGNVLHPTEKPVELIEKILDVTDIARVIFEPFSGSGTTLMACESMGRSCRAIELSPQFVAVALERWSTATGKTPERLDG